MSTTLEFVRQLDLGVLKARNETYNEESFLQ